MTVQIPEKLSALLTATKRYFVAYGGRGAGKSWAFADATLVRMMEKRVRFLCAREIQLSIKDSVHRLLRDRIEHHGLSEQFEVTGAEIRCLRTGSLCVFKGLRTDINEIKSLEGIDFCWIEEANRVSADSWDVLIPTIRNENSEIWISFNTGAETDPVYERFVKTARDNAIVVKCNYYDNPWFPEVLRDELNWDKQHNPERYKHVWLGEPGAEGQFFVEFGEHLKEAPFAIERGEMRGRLFGSLDSGTSHATAFGLWWVEKPYDMTQIYKIHRIFTYWGQGMTIKDHAQEIHDKIASCVWTQGFFPERVYADPSMWTKVKLNELMVRSPIDEYIDLFRESGNQQAHQTNFEKANNDKKNGCQLMRMIFRKTDGMPTLHYFDGSNGSFEQGITRVETDPNDAEVYAKQDGDDVADEARYGTVGVYTVMAGIRQHEKITKPKTHLARLLAGEFASKTKKSEW